MSEEEARHLYAVLHIGGFNEKREMSDAFRRSRTPIYAHMGKIIKRLRKALAALPQDQQRGGWRSGRGHRDDDGRRGDY